MPRNRTWTAEEIEFLRREYPHVRTYQLAIRLNRSRRAIKCAAQRFGIRKTEEYYKKHSGRFHRGQKAHNALYDGAITKGPESRGRSYYMIRVGPGEWQPLHRVMWESEYGRIPDGYVVAFRDGNHENCVIENLELITQHENGLRNRGHHLPVELKSVIRLNNKLKKLIQDAKE